MNRAISTKTTSSKCKIMFFASSRRPFKQLQTEDLNYFQSFLPTNSLITQDFDLEPYNHSIYKTQFGHSKLVLQPAKTEEVAKILKYCSSNNLAVVPQGGNTGLMGAGIPVFDEIILSLKKMNKICNFNEEISVLTLQSGCTLQQANEYLQKIDYQFPLSLASSSSCQVGGAAATRAGGIYSMKYGMFKSRILGMQVAIPNGSILNLLSQNQKDNTGYDLKHLFIGSQGSLGIITKLNILCPIASKERAVILLRVGSYSKILEWVKKAKQKLTNQINALQYFDGLTYRIASKHTKIDLMDDVKNLQYFLMIEVTNNEDAQKFMSDSLDEQTDAIMAVSSRQCDQIWKLREGIQYAASKQGRKKTYDLSFDINHWDRLTKQLRERLPQVAVLNYGHIGDGNMHINLCSANRVPMEDQQFYEMIVKQGGSISASYGVGIRKNNFLRMQKSEEILHYYKEIKSMFDPHGIMNPYKLLPENI